MIISDPHYTLLIHQSMTLDLNGGPLAGGTITVDGVEYIIPQNTLATLPGISVAWGELFVNGTANLPGHVSWQATVCLIANVPSY
jgi:hypothetical protein